MVGAGENCHGDEQVLDFGFHSLLSNQFSRGFSVRSAGTLNLPLRPVLAVPVKGYSPPAFVAFKLDMLLPGGVKLFR